MHEFRRPPAAPSGGPADHDEPADFLAAPAPKYHDGLGPDDYMDDYPK
jgi:hypothetical protein